MTLTRIALEGKAALIESIALSIETDPPSDATACADAVYALTVAGVYSIDIAREAQVAVSTVTRWGQGVRGPNPLMRPRVVAALIRAARATATALRGPDVEQIAA